MSSTPGMSSSASSPEPLTFEQHRNNLLAEIHQTTESILRNLNLINRTIEASVEFGRNMEQVEKLWSMFEVVVGADPGLAKPPEREAHRASEKETAAFHGMDDTAVDG
ncbi:hypothetical protein FN846DRAFT_907522 [Sphaerosporella brunnea]|uniref:DASH complex subunit DAD1 n=1 Tax=Sphaerosporella brunnea TaxID=1250544 RepID=A0A5J5EW42_9PEZI|nr:hypothetical protein FN846DRAFT_907522 [Sphaerosporella brunnea]